MGKAQGIIWSVAFGITSYFQLLITRTQILGPISSVSALGTNIIVVNDVDIAYELLEKRSATYSCRPTSVFGGEMFVSPIYNCTDCLTILSPGLAWGLSPHFYPMVMHSSHTAEECIIALELVQQ